MKIDEALAQLRDAAEHLRGTYPDIEADDEVWLTSLESLTTSVDLMDHLAERCLHLGALEDAAKERAAVLAARARRFAADQERLRGVILALVEAAGGRKLTLANVTLSPRNVPPKLVEIDAAQTPEPYLVTTTSTAPDRKAIKEALNLGADVPGWHLSNSIRSISLHTR